MLDEYKAPMRDSLTTMKVYDEERAERQRKECDETVHDYAPIEDGVIIFNQQRERVYPRTL